MIATYNRPAALSLCLQSVREQKQLPGEVVIADDGSGEETSRMIKEVQKDFPIPVKHVWHPDNGFRLAAIRNKGIAASTGDYIIQIDGDLILHPQFIADHLSMRKTGFFTAGSRVMLSPELTEKLIENRSTDLKKYGGAGLSFNGFRNRFFRDILASRYKIRGRHQFYVKGCNMAFHKKDLLKVNGYNEEFHGWGSEDREIAIRLINAGLKKQSAKMAAICYHLYHKTSSKEMETRNEELMQAAIGQKLVRAETGLNQYLTAGAHVQ